MGPEKQLHEMDARRSSCVALLLPLLQGQVVKAVIVETKKQIQRKDGRWAGMGGGRAAAAVAGQQG